VVSRGSTYDVGVVGAGPAGSTCAFYLARQGKRVLLLEKQRFPRDKLCGDAVCTRAQIHLERMAVVQDVLAAGEGRWAEYGGFVSPSGVPCLARSTDGGAKPLVIAVKARHHELPGSDPQLRAALGPAPRFEPMRAAPLRLGGRPGAGASMSGWWATPPARSTPLLARVSSTPWTLRRSPPDRSRRRSGQLIWARRSASGTTGAGWRPSAGTAAGRARWPAPASGYPVLLDASAEMMRRRGSGYFMEWAEAMTGLKPKRTLVARWPPRRRAPPGRSRSPGRPGAAGAPTGWPGWPGYHGGAIGRKRLGVKRGRRAWPSASSARGEAGLTAAWLLDGAHRVTLYERENRLGGHFDTVQVASRGQQRRRVWRRLAAWDS
jgi:hypothetical protein